MYERGAVECLLGAGEAVLVYIDAHQQPRVFYLAEGERQARQLSVLFPGNSTTKVFV